MTTTVDYRTFVACAVGAMVMSAEIIVAQPAFGPFSAGTPLSPSPRFIGTGVELADVNGDGLLDAVVSDNFGEFSYTEAVSVLLNGGGGEFAPPVPTSPVTEGSDWTRLALALGDFNEDGRADLVTSRLFVVTPPDGNRPNIAVLFGQTDGSFTGQVNLANSSTDRFMRSIQGRQVAVGDMNRDGHLDIVSPASSNSFSVLLGRGDGTFQPPIQSGAGFAEIVLVGDLDGDGDLDAVGIWNTGSDSRPQITIATNLNNGSGRFTAGPTLTLDTRTNIVNTGQARAFLADLDRDGKADLIVFGEHGSQSGAGGLYVLRSTGGGAFTQVFRETRAQDGNRTATIAVADFDGDGDPDIAKIPNAGASGEVLVNDGTGHFPTRVPLAADASYLVAAAAGQVAGSALPDIVMYDDPYENSPTRLRVATNLTPSARCVADTDDGSGAGNPDGGVTLDDLLYYLGLYAAGTVRADVDDGTGTNHPDGGVTLEDLLYYLRRYAAGC